MTTTDPKRIDHVIDRSSGRPQSEYWGYYEDQLISVKSTNSACEKMLDEYAYDLLSSDLVIPASALDGVCGDCGQTLDSLGLCGCQAEEPTPYTISEPQPCAGLQEDCRYYEVIADGAHYRLHNEWPNAIDFQDFSPTRWVGRDLGDDPPTGLPDGALVELRALWERLFSLPAWAETSPQPNDTLLDAAWRAYRATRNRDDADRVTWGDVVAIQRQFMPRCAAHGTHTSIKHNGNPICAQCIEERGPKPPAMRVAA